MRVSMAITAVTLLAIPTIASAHGGNNDSSILHACIGNVSKVVRVVGMGGACISAPPLLAETPAHWPQVQGTGPQGPKGDKGDQGIPGTNGINGIAGTSVTFLGYFSGSQGGCPNGGAIFTAGAVWAYVCNGQIGGRPGGPCFDNINGYVDCGNGTVTDTVTGLIWLKRWDCLAVDTWAAANQAAARLKNGECGLTDRSAPGDWRLPTKDEWQATVAQAVTLCGFGGGPKLTDDAGTACYGTGPSSFAGVALAFYWSSTTNVTFPLNAWVANLINGEINGVDFFTSKFNDFVRVWPVRGGPR